MELLGRTAHHLSSDVQFVTTWIRGPVSPVGTTTRNRWPSRLGANMSRTASGITGAKRGTGSLQRRARHLGLQLLDASTGELLGA
jgi:hypothetical protein